MPDMKWFGVRTVFLHTDFEETTYEERVTIHRAISLDAAIANGESCAAKYESEATRYLGYISAFEIHDEIGEGSEVYSLMRKSQLSPDEYIDRFFDTGQECQQNA